MCLMPLVLCRAQQMRLFRIYQNRADPDVYVAIVPKFVVFQGKVGFFVLFEYLMELNMTPFK